ncbi:CLUMA_CG017014, isoform A, partial [Clunio marinus]
AGWNDPPKNVKSTGNLKINLNKRVAFPLTSAPPKPDGQSNPSQLLPPKPPTSDSQSSIPTATDDESSSTKDLKSQKENVLSAFKNSAKVLAPSVSSKIDSLDKDWDECDDEVLQSLIELSNHIKAKDSIKAMATQRKIVMKGINKPWILAIRQIIMKMENVETSSDIATDALDPIT